MWPALIAAGAQLGGGFLGQSGASQANAKQMEFNATQAQLNRDFQERMSGTQYQRATADMRAAGLNPMLAYQQGGAGTPGGASASSSPQNTRAPLAAGISDAVSSAKDIQLRDAQINQANTSAYKNMVEGGRTQLETNLFSDDAVKEWRKKTILAQLGLIQSNAAETQARTRLDNAQTGLTGLNTRLGQQGLQSDWYTKYAAPWANNSKDVIKTLLPFGEMASSFFSKGGGQSPAAPTPIGDQGYPHYVAQSWEDYMNTFNARARQ